MGFRAVKSCQLQMSAHRWLRVGFNIVEGGFEHEADNGPAFLLCSAVYTTLAQHRASLPFCLGCNFGMIGHSWEGLQRGVGRLGDRRGYFWHGRWAARFIAYQYYGLLMNLCPKHILPFFARGFLVAAQMSPHSPLLGNHSSRRFRYDEVPLFRFICFTALPPLFPRPDPVVADRQCRRGAL